MLRLIPLKVMGIGRIIYMSEGGSPPHFTKLLFLNGSGSHGAIFSLLLYCNQLWNLRELFTSETSHKEQLQDQT